MREMKDSGIEWIGRIPSSWKTSKVKYFYDCYDGKRVPIDATLRKEGPYPYWGAGSITDHVDNYIFDEELVLVGEDGAPFFDKTRPVAFLINEKVWINNHIHVLKIKENTNPAFMAYFFNIVDYGSYINGSILNKLTQGNMNNIAFVFPCKEEEDHIVDYLDFKCSQIDSIIAKQEQIIEKLKEYKLSIITEAVTKGLNPDVEMKDSGIEWIGVIPATWTLMKLKYISEIMRGRFNHRPRNDPEYYDGRYPFVQTGEVARALKYISTYNQTLNEKGYAVSKEFPKGSVCMTIAANIGDVAILQFDACFPDSVVGFNPNEKTSEIYLFYVLSAMKQQLMRNSIISTQLNLNIEIIKEELVPISPITEQNQICKYLDKMCKTIDDSILSKEKIIKKYQEYKKSLIYEVVTGKKEV